MVYVDTRRPMWGWSQTGVKFLGTAIVAASYGLAIAQPSGWTLALATGLTLAKLSWELIFLRGKNGKLSDPVTRSARLLLGPLRPWMIGRVLMAIMALGLLTVSPWAALIIWALGEIIERLLFFRSGVAWRMPGN